MKTNCFTIVKLNVFDGSAGPYFSSWVAESNEKGKLKLEAWWGTLIVVPRAVWWNFSTSEDTNGDT